MNLFLYFLALICLSQSPTLIRWAHAPAEIIGFWRLLVSALLFAPWVQWRQLNGKKLMLCLGSGVFFFLHLWTFSLAAQNTAIANAMIIYSVNPLFTALGAYLFFKEKFTPRLGLAYIFAFLGIYYLVSHSLEFSPTSVRGDIYALISAPLFACFILLGQKMRKQLGVVTFSFVTYASTSVLFGCVALFHQISLTNYPQQTWIAIAGTIVLPTLLGHSLITYLLAHLNINFISCGKLIEPAIAAIVAYFMFAETLHMDTLYAFSLTALSVLVLFIPWSFLGPQISNKKS